MRHIDLDQFWPMQSAHSSQAQKPGNEAGTTSFAPKHVPETSAAPPPLPAAQTNPPPMSAPFYADDLENLPEELLAASAGWIAPPAPPITAHEEQGSTPPALTSPPEAVTLEAVVPQARQDPPETAAAQAPTAPAPRRKRDYTALVWGTSGFLAGMLAWHVVGFWSFVSNVVLNADDPRARTLEGFLPQVGIAGPAPEQKNLSRLSTPAKALIPVAAKKDGGAQFACVALAMDRSAGATRSVACSGTHADMRDAGFNRRTDRLALRPRLQDPVAWTGTTAVQISETAEPVAPETMATAPDTQTSGIETGTLRDADLKLDLNSAGLNEAH